MRAEAVNRALSRRPLTSLNKFIEPYFLSAGDFTFYPKESLTGLEESLEKVPLKEDQIIERVETFYEEKGVESPGVESKDFAITILNPVQTSK